MDIDVEDLLISESMPSYLKCPVCLDSLNDPRMLTCSHTVCCACLDNLVRFSNDRPTGYGPGWVISCPVCRRKLVIVSADKLLQNRGLAEAVIDWKRREKEEQFHRFYTFIKFCPTHNNMVADIWCSTCNTNICGSCRSVGSHGEHDVDHIEEMGLFSRSKASVLNDIHSVEEKIPDLVTRLHKVLSHEFEIREAYFRWCKNVDDQEARAHNVISEKFKVLMSSGQSMTTKSVNTLCSERKIGFETLNAIEDFFSLATSVMRTKSLTHADNENPSEAAMNNIEHFLKVTENTSKANIRDFKALLEAPLTKIKETVDRLQSGNIPDTRRRTSGRNQVIHGRVTSRHGAGRRGTVNLRGQQQQSVRILRPGTQLHIFGQSVIPPQHQQIPQLQPNIFLPQQQQFPQPQHGFGIPISPRLPNGPLFFPLANPSVPPPSPPAAAAGVPPPSFSSPQQLPFTSRSLLVTPMNTQVRDASIAPATSSTTSGGANNMGNFFIDDQMHPIETVIRTEPPTQPLSGFGAYAATSPSTVDTGGTHALRMPILQMPVESPTPRQVPQTTNQGSTGTDTGYSSTDIWNDSGMDLSESSSAVNNHPSQTPGTDPLDTGRQAFREREGGGMDYSSTGDHSVALESSFVTPESRHFPDQPPPLDYPPGRLGREAIRDIPLPPGSPRNAGNGQNMNGNNSNQLLGSNAVRGTDFSRGGSRDNTSNAGHSASTSSMWGEVQEAGFENDHTYYDMDQFASGYYIENTDGNNYEESEMDNNDFYSNESIRGFVESYDQRESTYNVIETVRRRGQPSLQGRRFYAPRNLIRLPLANENLTASIGLREDSNRNNIRSSEHETTFMETHL